MPDGDAVKPTPDPTILTTEAQERAEARLKEWIRAQLDIRDERLRGIDKATALLNETVNRTPTQIQSEIQHLRELLDVELKSIAQQFIERDERAKLDKDSERLARGIERETGEKALQAALNAQKESAADTNRSNQASIKKSEDSTKESIDKLERNLLIQNEGLSSKIDDDRAFLNKLELRINGIEQVKVGAKDNQQGLYALIAAVGGVLGLIVWAAGSGAFN
jgi:hypothetical protein